MSEYLHWLSWPLLLGGTFFFVAGTLGLLRFPDIYARLHAVTKADTASAPSGSRLPGTAHLQTFADATLRFAGPMASNGSASLSYSHMGRYFNDLQHTAELGGYGVADLNVRFGFENDPDLRHTGGPAWAFQCLTLNGSRPKGEVEFHPAFDAA